MSGDLDSPSGQVIQGVMGMEIALRQRAEESLRGLLKLVLQTASAFAGRELEEIRKKDPHSVTYWSPLQWQAFFDRHVLPRSRPQSWEADDGSRPAGSAGSRLEQEHQRLLRQLDALQADLQRKDRELEKLQAQKEALQLAFQALGDRVAAIPQPSQASPGDPALSEGAREVGKALPDIRPALGAPRVVSEDGVRPVGYAQILAELKQWKPIARPARFPQLFSAGVSEERWQRQSMGLSILARYGLGVRMELDWLISHAAGTKVNSGAQRITLDKLAETGLVIRTRLFESTPPLGSQLIVYSLSQDGKGLCDLLGWPVVESDWERIIRLHCQGDTTLEKMQEAHTLNILSFARNARYRGYRAMVMPVVAGKSAPDAYVERDGEWSYVEVERSVKEKAAKWQHQFVLQGQVAFCAVDPKSRGRLVADCKLDRSIRHGRATDMRTLMELAALHKEKVADTPLWVEEW